MTPKTWARRLRMCRRALLLALVAALATVAQAVAYSPLPDDDMGAMPGPGDWRPMLVHHMGQDLPDVQRATPSQLAVARRLMVRTQRRTARYATPALARRAGYVAAGRWGQTGLRHFNSRVAESDGHVLDPRRPESLLFWRRSDGTTRLVAAMFRAASDRPPPQMDNPLLRWHAHYSCVHRVPGAPRQMRSEACPVGLLAHYGTTQMLHVWFTGDLMTAYAMAPPFDALAIALGT